VVVYWVGLSLTGCLLALLLLLVVVRTALVVVRIENWSMAPTLEDGDRVLAWRYWPACWLRKGQVVLVWPWPSPSTSRQALGRLGFTPFIKRVAGLPGDTLVTALTDLAEIHRSDVQQAHDSSGHRTWHIPPGHLFVRGDNPVGGNDSLTWGPIPFRSVVGVVLMRLPGKESGTQRSSEAERGLQ